MDANHDYKSWLLNELKDAEKRRCILLSMDKRVVDIVVTFTQYEKDDLFGKEWRPGGRR